MARSRNSSTIYTALFPCKRYTGLLGDRYILYEIINCFLNHKIFYSWWDFLHSSVHWICAKRLNEYQQLTPMKMNRYPSVPVATWYPLLIPYSAICDTSKTRPHTDPSQNFKGSSTPVKFPWTNGAPALKGGAPPLIAVFDLQTKAGLVL